MWWVLVSARRGREPEAAPARSREGPGGGQDRTQDGLVCGSDSGGGGRFYLCTPTPSTWAHRGEQPPGAAGLGAGPAGRRGWAQGLLCGRRWAQCHFQTARGDDSRVYSPPRACRAPTPPSRSEAAGERPARTGPVGRGHSRQCWARGGLGEPARPCLIKPLGVGLHGNHLLGCSDK